MELLPSATEALYLALLISAPVLLTSLVVGIVVGVFQAATQVQEVSLSFIPKLLAVAVVLALSAGWMGSRIVSYTTGLWNSIPQLIQ